MPLSVDERRALRPGLDVSRLERFVDRLGLRAAERAHLLAAVSRPGGRGFSRGSELGGAMLPPQPEDFTLSDPELAAEWAAIADGVE